MIYNISDIEKELNITLDEDQKVAIETILSFIQDKKGTSICLSGAAGCGKTLVLSILHNILTNNCYSVSSATPTNKSKSVYSKYSNCPCKTIHNLLGLRPDINILEYDASKLLFKPTQKDLFNSREIIIIDECSMINDQLYESLLNKAQMYDSIIIWCGDECQLKPVEQGYVSKTFKDNAVVKLTKIHRQKLGPIGKVLQYLRSKPIYKFKSIEHENGSIVVFNNIIKMLKTYAGLFKVSSNFRDATMVKMVTYTNNRIQALNEVIRRHIYSGNNEYYCGEILTGYDQNKSISNSVDYIVEKIRPHSFRGLNAFKLTLKNDENELFDIIVISRNNSEESISNLAEYIEILRQKAIASKKSTDWGKFYQLVDSFQTPIDLVYDGRVIKRKSIDYGYCISAHKSQSSTYQIVLVDMENIYRCTNAEELRQMQYVALSRTSGDIIIYDKNGQS